MAASVRLERTASADTWRPKVMFWRQRQHLLITKVTCFVSLFLTLGSVSSSFSLTTFFSFILLLSFFSYAPANTSRPIPLFFYPTLSLPSSCSLAPPQALSCYFVLCLTLLEPPVPLSFFYYTLSFHLTLISVSLLAPSNFPNFSADFRSHILPFPPFPSSSFTCPLPHLLFVAPFSPYCIII
jgi:hypothetical protein